ncbi:hypothetical protein [Paenibacillus wenxiniae]|uniref:Uncharacterized protein n=1 Tax=Paenibacillus wenxiniae TaxID=1636843 RepID=A0ABW4RQU5_9BACL
MTYSEKSPRPYRESSAHKVLNPNLSTPSPSPASGQTKIDVHQLQKYVGNQAVAQSIMKHTTMTNIQPNALVNSNLLSPSSAIIQRQLGSPYVPKNNYILYLLNKHAKSFNDYMNEVSKQVDNARELIVTRAFANIPPVDGYMSELLDNFDKEKKIKDKKEFEDYRKIGRQAGYWIESYVTKVINIQPANGLKVIYQAKRGDTRPDIVVSAEDDFGKYIEIAWLDITSSSDQSTNHILQKAGNWGQALYARELLYAPIKIDPTDRTPVPAANANLKKLSEMAEALRIQNQQRHLALFKKHSWSLYSGLRDVFYEVKQQEINYIKSAKVGDHKKRISKNKLSTRPPRRKGLRTRDPNVRYTFKSASVDKKYSPEKSHNRYYQRSKEFFEHYIGKSDITRTEIASFIMGWNGILSRYEKNTKDNTYSGYLLSKTQAGAIVSDASGADGEVLVNEWLPI